MALYDSFVSPTHLCLCWYTLSQITAGTVMEKCGPLRILLCLHRVFIMTQMSTGCILGLLQLTDFFVVLLMCCSGVQLRCGQNVKQLYPADIRVYGQFNWTVGGNLTEHNNHSGLWLGSMSHHGNNKLVLSVFAVLFCIFFFFCVRVYAECLYILLFPVSCRVFFPPHATMFIMSPVLRLHTDTQHDDETLIVPNEKWHTNKCALLFPYELSCDN